jgi:ribosomal protein L1
MDNLTVSVGSRKFGVQTLLENSEEMIAYLKDNVDESKIWMETRGVVK